MFVTLKKKSVLFVSMAILLTAVMLGVGGQTAASVFLGNATRKVPVYAVDRTEKQVAISFDAAWGADKTQGIVDICNKYDVKATFFLVGFWIENYPDTVKMLDENGFEIGNHSQNHLKMSTLKESDIEKELASVNDSIYDLTGKTPKVFRPPFGDYNDRLVNKVNGMGMIPVQWDVDSLDWKGLSASEITNRVCSRVKNGSIVLFHNNSDNILEALPIIILKLKNEGYTFVTMSEQLYQEDYYIDNNGIQHKNQSN